MSKRNQKLLRSGASTATAAFPPMTCLGIGEMPGTLTTTQCVGGLLRGAEPYVLETLFSTFNSVAIPTDVSAFVETHRQNLTVSAQTEEVGTEDALMVSIDMKQALMDDVLAFVAPYFAEIDMDKPPEGWKDWLRQRTLKTLTATASWFIPNLFKDGALYVEIRVTHMWTADLLEAELHAHGSTRAQAYVDAFNFLYRCYLRLQKRQDEYTALTMEQINSKLTAKVKAKIHG